MSLLAARGRGRTRSKASFLQQWNQFLGGAWASVLPRRSRADGGRRSAAAGGSPGLVAMGLLLLGLGYLLGSAFPWSALAGEPQPDRALRADGDAPRSGIAPGPIGEDFRPLARDYFLTAAYEDKSAALQAARHLQGRGLAKARPLPVDGKDGRTLFALVVYFDGDGERTATAQLLQSVAAPDSTFDYYRNNQKGWPVAQATR